MQTELLLKCYTIKQHFKRKNLRSSCEFCLPLQVSDRPGQQYWLYCYLSIFFKKLPEQFFANQICRQA